MATSDGCALRAKYSTCLSFQNGTNSLLALDNLITPHSETPNGGSKFIFKGWEHKCIAAYNYLQFQIEGFVFGFEEEKGKTLQSFILQLVSEISNLNNSVRSVGKYQDISWPVKWLFYKYSKFNIKKIATSSSILNFKSSCKSGWTACNLGLNVVFQLQDVCVGN